MKKVIISASILFLGFTSISCKQSQESPKQAIVSHSKKIDEMVDFFQKGNINFSERRFINNYNSFEEAENAFLNFCEQNKDSPYLRNYKGLASALLIGRFDLKNFDNEKDKKRFLKYFTLAIEDGTNLQRQKQILAEIKPKITQNEYKKLFVSLLIKQEIAINRFKDSIAKLEEKLNREQNPAEKEKLKRQIKVQKEALEFIQQV
ncbi:MAG: hypothetical protein ACK4NY_23055 [Spirosomataceae bacterium]